MEIGDLVQMREMPEIVGYLTGFDKDGDLFLTLFHKSHHLGGGQFLNDYRSKWEPYNGLVENPSSSRLLE